MTIRFVQESEITLLKDISIKTFVDAFGTQNKPSDMAMYIEESRNIDQVRLEFEDPNQLLYFVEDDDQQVIGFMKINKGGKQTENYPIPNIELERIYLLEGNQGKGYGENMLAFFEELGNSLKVSMLWLGVWKENPRAVKFYQRHGFEIFGEHDYLLGTDLQRDFVLRKMI